MSWYKNNKTEWKEIIDAVSTEVTCSHHYFYRE